MCIRDRLSGGSIGTHLQMGIGDGVIPDILNQDIYDDICIVKDEEAIRVSKELASKEGLMCGISSGTNAVSYTHLDVYKRQIRICSGTGFDALF